MSAWAAQHLAAFVLAVRRLLATPATSVLSVLAIGIALTLPAGGQMLLANLTQLARSATPLAQLSVFVRVDGDAKASASVARALHQHTGLRDIRLLPKGETLARMKVNAGLKEAIEVLGHNPFPDAFVLTPKDDSPAAMEALANELRALPDVDHVQLDSAWVARLDALLRLFRTLVVALSLLLAAGLLAITFNIIRLQVLSLTAEIELSRLLGATEAFIRRPFVHYGFLLGLLGALVAWLFVAAAAHWLRAPLRELASLYGMSLEISGLALRDSAVLVFGAAALGATGAALSVSQHTR